MIYERILGALSFLRVAGKSCPNLNQNTTDKWGSLRHSLASPLKQTKLPMWFEQKEGVCCRKQLLIDGPWGSRLGRKEVWLRPNHGLRRELQEFLWTHFLTAHVSSTVKTQQDESPKRPPSFAERKDGRHWSRRSFSAVTALEHTRGPQFTDRDNHTPCVFSENVRPIGCRCWEVMHRKHDHTVAKFMCELLPPPHTGCRQKYRTLSPHHSASNKRKYGCHVIIRGSCGPEDRI